MWLYQTQLPDFPTHLHDAGVAEDLSKGQMLMDELQAFLGSMDSESRGAIVIAARISALNSSTPVPQEWRHRLEHFLDRLSWPS